MLLFELLFEHWIIGLEIFSIQIRAILNYRLTELHIKSFAKFSHVILLKKQIKLTFPSESY